MCTPIVGYFSAIRLLEFTLVKKYTEAIPSPKEEDMVNDYLDQINDIKHVAEEGAKEVVSSIGKLNKLWLIENRHRSGRLQNKYDRRFAITTVPYARKPEGDLPRV